MFESIEIQNFRGIEQLKVDGLKRFNLIVGDNNSKKTTLLEAIFLLSSQPENVVLNWINKSRGLSPESQHFFSTLFYKAIYLKTLIQISGKWNKGFITNTKVPMVYKRDAVIGENYEHKEVINNKDSLLVENRPYSIELTLIDELIRHPNHNNIEKEQSTIRLSRDFDNKNNLIKSGRTNLALREIPCFLITEELLNDSKFNSRMFETSRKKRALETVLNSVKTLVPTLENIALDIQQKIYCTLKDDINDYPIEVMGDGFRKLFSFLTTSAASKDGVLLIDEIENGFYYQKLGICWEHVFKTAMGNNIQLFATTHSKECIDAYLQQIEAGGYSFDDFNIIRMTHDHENKPVAVIFSGEELKENYDNNWEMRR